MNTQRPLGKESLQSWFLRLVVTDYYDGPKEALAECVEGHVASLRCIDWDDGQNVRIFEVVEMHDQRFSEVEKLLKDQNPRWPCCVLQSPISASVEALTDRLLLAGNRPPDYVIACTDPLGSIISSEAPAGEANRDWFAAFGLDRRSTDNG